MAQRFGLPLPEQRIGLSAHDFVSAASARRVVLTRAERIEGAPSVPSRWLLRLESIGLALDLPALQPRRDSRWQLWARALDRPSERLPERPPAPCPPVEARPRKVSVTRVETWLKDPYALYAERVLGLSALEDLDADPSQADRGSLIHAALEAFVRDNPGSLPADAAERLIAAAAPMFEPLRAQPALFAFWWPRFCRVARWFVEEERRRRPQIARSAVERRGALTLSGPAGDFVLTATADRIDQGTDGSLELVDYKTGRAPGKGDVEAGLAPQLALEAAMLEAGAFEDLPADLPASFAFWVLTGGDPPGAIERYEETVPRLASEAIAGLERLIAAFDDPATAYRAQPRDDLVLRYNDYQHLARVKAWSGGGQAS